jgi:hypothetical protein
VSADARVARAIQRVREIEALRRLESPAMTRDAEYESAVDDLIEEAKDALHLTDDDIAQY